MIFRFRLNENLTGEGAFVTQPVFKFEPNPPITGPTYPLAASEERL